MNKFKEYLEKNEFVYTAEIFPPKGVNVRNVIKKALVLKPWITAINLTDNQSAIMSIAPFGLAYLIKNEVDVIYQITCRDRNRLAIQSDLLAAWILGIRNVLALTGDHVSLGDHPHSKPVFDLDSVQLVYLINSLNNGFDLEGNVLDGATDFYIGSVINQNASNLELELIKAKKKIKQGARFFQTQVVYNVDRLTQVAQKIKKLDAKIIATVMLLKSARYAEFLNRKLPGVRIPGKVILKLKKAPNQLEGGIEIAIETINKIKSFVDGIHLIAIGFEEVIPNVISRL